MAGSSYIRVYYNGAGTDNTGRKLYLNIEPVQRSKGIPTSDFPIPTLTPDSRVLIPTGGNQDDFVLNIVLQEESSKVGANMSSLGSETDRTDVRTIQEQWDFLFDEILEVPSSTYNGGVFAKYELYLDWNSTTYTGWLQGQSAIDNEEFTGRVEVRLTFKRGLNPLTSLT